MNQLPNELIIEVFNFILKITDKRQFLRTCILYNNLTRKPMLNYVNNHEPKCFRNVLKCSVIYIIKYSMENFTLELCHDSYFNLIPDHYIIPKNLILIRCLSYYNNVQLLSIAKQKGCDIRNALNFGAYGGHISVIEWGLKNGCSFDNFTCSKAALGGQLNVLQWLWNNNCYMDSVVCSYAAENGDLKMLKWAREHSCSWGKTAQFARTYNQLELLQWAIDNGCPD